jgi:histidine triad (HIT) family protein
MDNDPDCIFCKIAAGTVISPKLIDEEVCFAIADLNPQAPKHFLVIPKRHIGNISKCDDPTFLGRLIQCATRLAVRENLESGYRLVVNTGEHGGQTVNHLHIHLLGGRFMSWPPG